MDSESVASTDTLAQDAAALMDAAPTPSEMRDKFGTAFDSSIHAVDADGKPRSKKDGAFAKKRGRPAGTASGNPTPPSVGLELPPRQEQRAMAEQIVDASTVLLAIAFGPQWLLMDPDQMKSLSSEPLQQREAIIGAVANYLKARPELATLPPEAVLLFALAGYVMPRAIHTETRTRAQKAFDWIRRKIGGKRFARAHPRTDGERKDVASQKVDG